MAKQKPKSRRKSYIVVALAVLLVLGAIYALFRIHNPSVGFTYYEPSYLPAGVSVKDKRILVTAATGNTSVGQNFRTEDWVYSIHEYQAGIQTIGTAAQNYDSTSQKPTCSIKKSSAGMQYRLCHWIDYGRINVYQVRFIKNGTFVHSLIPAYIPQTISEPDIDTYVDSFAAKSTTGITAHRVVGP